MGKGQGPKPNRKDYFKDPIEGFCASKEEAMIFNNPSPAMFDHPKYHCFNISVIAFEDHQNV